MINPSLKQIFKKGISFCLVLLISCLFVSPAEAKLEIINKEDGVNIKRSLESLRDLENQTWQLVAYPNQINGNEEKIILRIIGFSGSLRLDHSRKLKVKSGIKYWDLNDITLQNPQLLNDNRDAAAEFELEPLIKDLNNSRPLRLSLKGGFNELPVPPYLVNEWRLLDLEDDK